MNTPVDDFIAPPCLAQIELLYQDDVILVINKPSGLLSLSGKNPLNKDSVHYRLRQQFPHCLMTHRLDLGTSGLMVLALDKLANAQLTHQFQNRSVEKQYIAILKGHLPALSGQINESIAKGIFPRMNICAQTGKAASSDYQVLGFLNNPARTKVLFTPTTGRTHQLRIHSLTLGHPILGCDLYNDDDSEHMASRLLLHASELRFCHPSTKQPLTFHSDCPF